MAGSSKGVTVKELCHSFRISRFGSHMLIWSTNLMELAVVRAQNDKRTQMDSEYKQTPMSLSALFLNLRAWNHCPGHELSPKRTI